MGIERTASISEVGARWLSEGGRKAKIKIDCDLVENGSSLQSTQKSVAIDPTNTVAQELAAINAKIAPFALANDSRLTKILSALTAL